MVREEYNLPLTAEAYAHLREKADGKLITKRRYLIPFGKYTIELDLFSSPRPDLMLAEVHLSLIHICVWLRCWEQMFMQRQRRIISH